MGKILMIMGAILVVIGLVIQYAHNIPFLGKLPGNVVYERDNIKVYIPIATSILLSILLSLVLFLISRFRGH